jgi:hypothetical protein
MMSLRYIVLSMSAAVVVGIAGCQSQQQDKEQEQARVATSFWKIATPAYSDVEGYRIIQAEGKTRHCYPVTDWVSGYGEDDYHNLHHHGVAVESELMAYRIYFDKKQTIDVYCKRTPRLELAESYWYPNDSLLAAHYGDDILRVGGTVGVGTVKYWNGHLCHITEVGERQQHIVRQTADTAVIAVTDIDWTVPDGKQDLPETRTIVNLHAEYTMCAGHRDMRCDVTVSERLEGLCTGVQRIKQSEVSHQLSEISVQKLENGVVLSSWGTDWPVNDTVKYAKETVGLGVFIPKEFAGELVHDAKNNLCLLKLSPFYNQYSEEYYQAHFYLTCVGATKEDNPVARNAEEWKTYLRDWAASLK